jgi:microsomal dipeptidase-like Zn-dependent dipeptidase
MSDFGENPLAALAPFIDLLLEGGPLEGDYCQNHGLTPLGEFLFEELMKRGMIIEIDHLPRRGYQRAFELLTQHDYPAAGTHGLNNGGALYALGGISKSGLGRCHHPTEPGRSDDGYQARIALITDMGGFPAEGFGFDLNGFAGAPGPRFGPRSACAEPQSNPVTYPFTSWAGDVTFTEPRVGDRLIDFNTEGFAHIGFLPELIEDVRLDGVPDEDLEPLFKSAEAYLRMWELAEARGAVLKDELGVGP